MAIRLAHNQRDGEINITQALLDYVKALRFAPNTFNAIAAGRWYWKLVAELDRLRKRQQRKEARAS